MRSLLPATLYAATVCFALGVTLPLVRIERFLILSDEPSLVGMVVGLWRTGDWAISGLIMAFSIVFPAMKLYLLHMAAYADADHPLPAWFRPLSNWSMLDVVLVAIVVFAAKTSGLATAFTQPGLWFFAGSVVLTVAAAYLVKSGRSPRDGGASR